MCKNCSLTTLEIRRKVLKSIDYLYKNDISLIKRGCSERSIVFRLGIYLNEEFKKYGLDVDCEYNRNIDQMKELPGRKRNFPDLIIHKRECNYRNILVIEVKTPNDIQKEDIKNDYEKITGFIDSEVYRYRMGAHIYISNTEYIIIWYTKSDFTKEIYKLENVQSGDSAFLKNYPFDSLNNTRKEVNFESL
jgi:hypothetical protein